MRGGADAFDAQLRYWGWGRPEPLSGKAARTHLDPASRSAV